MPEKKYEWGHPTDVELLALGRALHAELKIGRGPFPRIIQFEIYDHKRRLSAFAGDRRETPLFEVKFPNGVL